AETSIQAGDRQQAEEVGQAEKPAHHAIPATHAAGVSPLGDCLRAGPEHEHGSDGNACEVERHVQPSPEPVEAARRQKQNQYLDGEHSEHLDGAAADGRAQISFGSPIVHTFSLRSSGAVDEALGPEAAAAGRELVTETVVLVGLGHLAAAAEGAGGEGEALHALALGDVLRLVPDVEQILLVYVAEHVAAVEPFLAV